MEWLERLLDWFDTESPVGLGQLIAYSWCALIVLVWVLDFVGDMVRGDDDE